MNSLAISTSFVFSQSSRREVILRLLVRIVGVRTWRECRWVKAYEDIQLNSVVILGQVLGRLQVVARLVVQNNNALAPCIFVVRSIVHGGTLALGLSIVALMYSGVLERRGRLERFVSCLSLDY